MFKINIVLLSILRDDLYCVRSKIVMLEESAWTLTSAGAAAESAGFESRPILECGLEVLYLTLCMYSYTVLSIETSPNWKIKMYKQRIYLPFNAFDNCFHLILFG